MPNIVETTDAAASTSTSYTLVAGQSAQGQLAVAGDRDWYRIDLVAGQTYTFGMTATGDAASQVRDTYLRLRDSAGMQIAFDDDSGDGLNSSITFTAITSGTYYLDAGAYNDVSAGQYDLSVATETLPPPAGIETTDAAASTATTYALAGGQTVRGNLAATGDRDWYRIELVAGQTYTFAMAGSGAAGAQVRDTYLRLRDSTGAQIAFDDDSGEGLNSTISFTATSSGVYYLDAGSYNNAYAGQYDLTVAGPPPQPPFDPGDPLPPARVTETADAAASATTAYSLAIGKSAQGQLGTAGDHDWYGVNLVAGQTYTFAMVGTGISGVNDSYLRLYSGAGAQIAYDDDGGPGGNSTITFTATTSGTYYLDAGAYNDASAGQYGLSATLGSKASYDEMMGAGALIRPGASWSTPGTAASVTWGIRQSSATATDASGNPTPFIAPSAAQIASVQAGLALYSEVANLTFSQVNPGGTTNDATILVGAYSSNVDGAGAFAYYPGSTASGDLAGDIWLNNTSVSTTSLPNGSFSAFAIAHEMGHAMGLAHPGDYNAAPGLPITYANNAQFVQDDHQYSVMSYFDESNTTASYNAYPDTLMLYDILAVQQLYGANMTTRADNTVYGFHSNAGSVYDFAINRDPALCIWDGGGTDTVDASGFGQNQMIDLHDGSFSNMGGFTGNISIAFGAIIENAIGGSGSDTLTGNSASNALTGGAGADTFCFKDFLGVGFSIDTITDFSAQDDTIRLDPAIFTALAPGGPLSADAFHVGSIAADASDRIMYDSGSGALYYDRDGAGGRAAVCFANLSGGLAVTSADFQVASRSPN